MKKIALKAFCILLCAMLAFSVIPMASAASTYNKTVNLLTADRNLSGQGYYFDNIKDTLTLRGINIDTTDDYGLKIKNNITVVLEGNNYIKASKIGLYCQGTFTIKGSGTLTIVSEGKGIVLNTDDLNHKIRILDGNLVITSSEEGIYSLNGGAAIAGGSVDINVTKNEFNAISTHALSVSGDASLKANSGIYASYKINITAANMDIKSSGSAISCDGQFNMADMSIKAGATENSLTDIELDSYNGEAAVLTKSTANRTAPSIIFGEGVPVVVDYLILVAAIVVLAALIAIPILKHNARIKRLEESGQAGNARKKKARSQK